MSSCGDVRLHYEQAAEHRDQRLRTRTLNAAKVNHQNRYGVIASLLRQVGPVNDGIDIGTGTGVWAEVLADYCQHVVGIDFAEQNIRIARVNAAERHLSDCVSYRLGDAQRLDGFNPDSFDVAMHISVLQHLPDHGQALRRVHEILRDGGHLVLLVHNRRCLYNRNLSLQRKTGHVTAINEYHSVDEIRTLLREAGFDVQSVRLCWLCVNDWLFLGVEKAFLKPLMPLRKALIVALGWLGRWMSGRLFLHPLFREIVVLARKKDPQEER